MLYQMFLNTVERYSHRTAVTDGTSSFTYGQLALRVTAAAAMLNAEGVDQSKCIATVLRNGVDFISVFFAAARQHCLLLPLDPLLTRTELQRAVQQCGVSAVVAENAALSLGVAPVLRMPEPIMPLAQDLPKTSATDGDFLVQFSSGSTGRPKQVRRTHRNLIAEADHFAACARVTAEDRILCVIPLHHAHGLGNCLLASVRSGACLIIPEHRSPDREELLQTLERERITIFPGVPFLFDVLARAEPSRTVDLSALRLCFSAGNFLAKKTFDSVLRRFGVSVRQLYGCTEAGSLCLNLEPDAEATWDSVGRPLGDVRIRVVEGEIAISSPALTSGYIDAPDANGKAFRDGSFYLGDLGRMDDCGRLYLTGRKRILIDTGGHKVDPAEVEDALLTHPKVAEAIVVGMKCASGGELVHAAVVLQGTCTEEELDDYCRQILAAYKVPEIIDLVAEIPRNRAGKILAGKLIAELQSPGVQSTENFVRHQIGKMLGVAPESLDRRRPLMEYGLESAMGVRLASRLERFLGTSVSATLIWNYPTIAAIVDRMSGQPADAVPSDVAEVSRLSDEAVAELLAQMSEPAMYPGEVDERAHKPN